MGRLNREATKRRRALNREMRARPQMNRPAARTSNAISASERGLRRRPAARKSRLPRRLPAREQLIGRVHLVAGERDIATRGERGVRALDDIARGACRRHAQVIGEQQAVEADALAQDPRAPSTASSPPERCRPPDRRRAPPSSTRAQAAPARRTVPGPRRRSPRTSARRPAPRCASRRQREP